MDNAAAYEAARERITDLVKNSDPATPVPTCPGWSVKDVVAHLSGSLAAYVDGKLEGAASPAWGDRQVEERRDRSLDDCLAEWEAGAGRTGPLFDSRIGAVAVADVLAHEQDIRTAVGSPGPADREGMLASVELALAFVEQKMQASDRPALRIVTEDVDRVLGGGEPAATLRTSTFELWRALHGRRSLPQVRMLDWDGDPETWMGILFLFGPAESDIHE